MNILASDYWTIWLLVLWVAPLLGFCIQMTIGPKLPREGDWVSIGAIGVSFVIAVLLFGGMLQKKGGLHNPKTDSWVWVPAEIASGVDQPEQATEQAEESAQQAEKVQGEQEASGWLPDHRESLPELRLGFHLDNLAILILIVVTGVSLLVHIYSMGYMHGDPLYHRFFAFLNLFSFSMLGLVLVDNLIGLYIFWELVGVSSYLLIGFWFDNEDLGPAKASIKAFLTTRVGDIGMFIGILLIIFHLGVLDYQGLFAAVKEGGAAGGFSSHGVWTFAGVMLFMGAVGKSAQFPLHIWLPDAMEGPTPVSALIHAATMVAAGVYMVARLFPFFTSEALIVIAVVGGVTAMFAATMALVADDIKRVLAYSTISQLGYMVLALGVGAWFAGILHLYTHAFFKALLFLCSGSVIHAVHTNDMWKMGGLSKAMPWTFGTMLVASLSISGVPLFSGFVSKDKILHKTLLFNFKGTASDVLGGTTGAFVDWLLPILAFAAAVLTAFYMFRLIFLTFTGEPRDEEAYEHAHESPNSMVIPLVTLALLSTFLVVQFVPFTTSTHFDSYLHKPARADSSSHEESHASRSHAPVAPAEQEHVNDEERTNPTAIQAAGVSARVAKAESGGGHEAKAEDGHGGHGKLYKKAHTYTLVLSLLVVVVGIGFAGLMYWAPMKVIAPGSVSGWFKPLYILFQRTYYFDELFYYGFVIPSIQFSRFLAGIVDLRIIDAFVDDVAYFTIGCSDYSWWWDDHVVDRLVLSTADSVGASGDLVRSSQDGNIRTYVGFIGTGILLLALLLIGVIEFGLGTPVLGISGWIDDLFQSTTAGIFAILFASLLLTFLGSFGSALYEFWFGSTR
jgi:NADH-quinone oxidoreductase subunit L